MLTEESKSQLTQIFKNGDPLAADDFFNRINIEGGLGRAWDWNGKADKPFERLRSYETLLKEIYDWNSEIFHFIHKGTPYYFSGIHAFDIEDYNRALFYFDAGLSEDIRNKPGRNTFHWTNSASYGFYKLNESYGNEIVTVPVGKLRKLILPLIDEFNVELGPDELFTIDILINSFVKSKVKVKEYRSIIPALYLFIYESEQKLFQLQIRSDLGGSIEPFILHLLKGCLIFESLIKLVYPSHIYSELATIMKDPIVKKDINYCQGGIELIDHAAGIRKTLQDIISNLIPYLEDEGNRVKNSDKWLTLTYALRNVTAHNLTWDDRFNPENYMHLYRSVLFSIFYLIFKKFKPISGG